MKKENEKNQIKIQPLRIKNLNCYDNNIIADISSFFKRDYRLSLLGEFDFTYRNIDKTEELLDYNDIFTGDILYVPYLLSQLVGITLEHIEIKERGEYANFIEKILIYIENKIPVGVALDSYYLPWNPQYMILHRRHYVLIIGVNYKEKIFYCLDSYLSDNVQKIPIDIIFNKHDRLVLVKKLEEEKDFSIDSVINNLILCLSNSGKSECCDGIRNFSKDIIRKKFLVDKNVSGTILENSNFLFRLTDIANSRYNFLQGLTYLIEKFRLNNMDDVLEETYNVFIEWEIIRRIITRGYISGRVSNSLQRAAEKLKEIADKEEDILNKLKIIGNL